MKNGIISCLNNKEEQEVADFEYPSIRLAWNDPDFEEKIKSYVLEFYDVFRRASRLVNT